MPFGVLFAISLYFLTVSTPYKISESYTKKFFGLVTPKKWLNLD
jgi:hypothetical protein